MSEKQVKSKQRVADHGEVFTAEREVKAMCDLVKPETERIDSRFLEPACGEGAFLTEILRRKLAVVKRQYGKSPADYEKYSVIAITSLYGVDILEDNAEICRQKLFEIWDAEYTANAKSQASDQCRETVRQLLEGHEEQMSLDMVGWQYDEEVQAFIPAPVREYPPTDYRRLADYE